MSQPPDRHADALGRRDDLRLRPGRKPAVVTDPDNNTLRSHSTRSIGAPPRPIRWAPRGRSPTTPLGTSPPSPTATGVSAIQPTIWWTARRPRRGATTPTTPSGVIGTLFDAADRSSTNTTPIRPPPTPTTPSAASTSASNAGTPGVRPVVFNYAYDTAGNLQSITDTFSGAVQSVQVYGYDALNRVINVIQLSPTTITPRVNDKRVDLTYNNTNKVTSIVRSDDLAASTTSPPALTPTMAPPVSPSSSTPGPAASSLNTPGLHNRATGSPR